LAITFLNNQMDLYSTHCLRKFMFFQSQKSILIILTFDKLSIPNILKSPVLFEFFSMISFDHSDTYQRTSWFSPYTAMNTYINFQNLNPAKDGLLTRKDMELFRNGELSPFFIDKLFENTQTYNSKIDYFGIYQ
jgi:serine/threonine-protein phosphatase 2A regulatory subunit B''